MAYEIVVDCPACGEYVDINGDDWDCEQYKGGEYYYHVRCVQEESTTDQAKRCRKELNRALRATRAVSADGLLVCELRDEWGEWWCRDVRDYPIAEDTGEWFTDTGQTAEQVLAQWEQELGVAPPADGEPAGAETIRAMRDEP